MHSGGPRRASHETRTSILLDSFRAPVRLLLLRLTSCSAPPYPLVPAGSVPVSLMFPMESPLSVRLAHTPCGTLPVSGWYERSSHSSFARLDSQLGTVPESCPVA